MGHHDEQGKDAFNYMTPHFGNNHADHCTILTVENTFENVSVIRKYHKIKQCLFWIYILFLNIMKSLVDYVQKLQVVLTSDKHYV